MGSNDSFLEAGWLNFLQAHYESVQSVKQIHEMRLAYFAGAQRIWAGVMTVASKEDLKRYVQIENEIKAFLLTK